MIKREVSIEYNKDIRRHCFLIFSDLLLSGDDISFLFHVRPPSRCFDDAIVKFATDYADQTERDHAAFLKAIRSGRISATPQE